MNKPNIIFEDEKLIVVNKPSGWITNEAKTTGEKPVLQTWLKNNFQYPICNSHEFRSGIVHRLDKETSGVLVIAKTEEAFRDLQRQFKERKVKKTYTALVHGKVEPEVGVINAPVGRLPWNRERFGVLPGGRNAVTGYKVISYFIANKDLPNIKHHTQFTLLELFPKTGRTHQIRIHLKHIGHPIVSDEFYAGRKRSRSDRKWCPRLFLHASKLEIDSPVDDKRLSFEYKLPNDLEKALKNLSTPDA